MITHPAPVFCFRRELREESGRQKNRDQIKEEKYYDNSRISNRITGDRNRAGSRIKIKRTS